MPVVVVVVVVMFLQVKVLGALAMIDSGELDWKAIAINVNDPLYDLLNSKDDVEQLLPGVISGEIDTYSRI